MWDIGGRKGRTLLLQGHQCVTGHGGGGGRNLSLGEARETLVFWRLPFDESTFDSFSVSPECLVFCSERGKKA